MLNPVTPGGLAELVGTALRDVRLEVGEEDTLQYPLWINEFEMDRSPLTDQQVTGFGVMDRKPIGTAFPRDNYVIQGQKTTEALEYGKALELTFEAMLDEQYGIFRTAYAEMLRSGRERQEIAAASVLNNATDTAFVGFTPGEALGDDHVGEDGVTRTNLTNVGFGVTGIQGMILHFQNLRTDRGRHMRMRPEEIIIHAANNMTAREILGSNQAPYTSDNEINALVAENLSWMVSNFLDSTARWFGLARGHDLWMGWSVHPMSDVYDDPNSWNAIAVAYQRHTLGFFRSWRGVYVGQP